MKALTDNNRTIGMAREAQDRLCDLDSLLYTMDGEIPNEKANLAVKSARRHVIEALKKISYVAEGMWTPGLGDANPDTLAEHINAVAGMTDGQLVEMLGRLQQAPGQESAYEVLHQLCIGRELFDAIPEQESGRDWYERELEFAMNAHDLTPELSREVAAILTDPDRPNELGNLTDEQYRQAAQLLACRRNTCGHVHTFDPVQGPAEGPDDAPNPWQKSDDIKAGKGLPF
jgi:hypothetical protein